MATASVRIPSFGGAQKTLLTVVGLLALYFGYRYVFHYYTLTEESYGPYWPVRAPLLLHVSGGLAALLVGVGQLATGLGGVGMRVHPVAGRVYVAGVLAGAIGGWLLSIQASSYGFAWGVGLFSLATAWFAITAMALYFIRKRNVRLHRQWMIRSYIVTFAFVTFRLITDFLPYQAWWGISPPDMAVAAIWPVWVAPLLAYEMYLQYAELRR